MKFALIAILLGSFFDKIGLAFGFLPKASLIFILILAMGADLVLAIIRIKLAGRKLTAYGYNKTIIKFCQYFGAISIGLLISYLSSEATQFNSSWKYTPQVMSYINNAIIIFMIRIEVRSCIKHLMGMDKKTEMSKSLFSPVLKVLSVKIKNNEVINTIIEDDGDDDVADVKIEVKNISSPNIKK